MKKYIEEEERIMILIFTDDTLSVLFKDAVRTVQ
jgi:hypothetical protein